MPMTSARGDRLDRDLARRSIRRGWIVVAAAFTVMFATFGCAYSFSAFFSALQTSFGASRGALSWVLSIAISLFFVIGALSGPIADRFGPRAMAIAGALIVGLGLFVAARAEALWQVYLGFGLGIGIGIGISYVPSVGAVQRWFFRQRGLASGIAVAGIGASTLVTPKIAEWLIDAYGWRGAYLVLGGFAVLAAGTAGLFLDNSPQRHGFLPDGGIASTGSFSKHSAAGVALAPALRSKPFLLLYAAVFCTSFGLFLPFAHLTPFAEDRGISHATAVTLFTLVGIGSTFGRFLLGGLADRMGRRRSFAAMLLGMALMLAWWIVCWSAWQIAIFALVFGTCYGGFVALSPALIVDYFGERNASGLIGISYTAVAFGTLSGSPLAGYAFDWLGSYTLPIAISAAAMLAGSILMFCAPDPAKG
jgi:MFS family permease